MTISDIPQIYQLAKHKAIGFIISRSLEPGECGTINPLQHALRGRNAAAARVEFHRHAQGPRRRLENSFDDMVRIATIMTKNMQVHLTHCLPARAKTPQPEGC